MNADAKLGGAIFGHARVALDHAAPRLDRNAPRMTGDGRIDQIAARPSKARRCPILIQRWEAAVSDDVRNQGRRYFAGFAHSASPAGHDDTKKVPEQPCSANPTEGDLKPSVDGRNGS
jgi:hypothetical protein